MEENLVKVRVKRAIGKDRAYWSDIIAQWKESNEKQQKFCDRLGIKLGTFSYWRHIFSKDINSAKPKGKRKKEINFIPINMGSLKKESDKIVIKSKNGTKIVISGNPNTELLKAIVNLLGFNHD